MIRLSDGNDMPAVGLTSFRRDSMDDMSKQIGQALQSGIRCFEITELFGNEHMVMEALQHVPRHELFISLRLWPKGRKYKDILKSVKESLMGANLNYVDLLVLHAPIDPINKFDQWKAMEELKDDGYVKSLGAGSLTLLQLMDLLKNCNFPPAILEIEVTPFYQLAELIEYCNDSSIAVISNEPLAKGLRRDNEVIRSIADFMQISPDEVMIRWSISKGFATLIPPQYVNNYLNNSTIESLTSLPPDIMTSLGELNCNFKTTWDTNDEEIEQ